MIMLRSDLEGKETEQSGGCGKTPGERTGAWKNGNGKGQWKPDSKTISEGDQDLVTNFGRDPVMVPEWNALRVVLAVQELP